MKKHTIIVRKQKGERVVVGVLGILIPILFFIYCIFLRVPTAAILSLPLAVILFPLVIYTSTWQLRFEDKYILKQAFFRNAGKYSYAQLREVRKVYSTANNGYCIRMYFTDGKTITFRMADDGASKAVKILQRHRSIQTK